MEGVRLARCNTANPNQATATGVEPERVGERAMEPMLTIQQASELLNVPVGWLYERTRKQEIPHAKLGKYIRFNRAVLLAWVAAQQR
jgi:excisionase family DNA binding protein